MEQSKGPDRYEKDLRNQAEKRLAEKFPSARDISSLNRKQIEKLVHELQVYQIELEVQTEDLRRTQCELENLKDKYLHLYDFAPVGYVTVAEDGIIEEANLTACRLLKLDRRLLIHRPFSRFVSRDDQDAYYLFRRRLFETGSPQVCSIRLVSRSDEVFHAQLIAAVTEETADRPVHCRIAIHDITQSKLAQEALQRSEAMLRAVLQQMPSGVTARDARTGELVVSNEAARRLMGALVDLPQQFEFYRASDPGGRPYRNEELPISRSMATGEVVDAEEVDMERRDGSRITLSISSAPVCDPDGRILMGVGVFHDITDRKKGEQERNQTMARLAEYARMLEQAQVFVRDMDDRIVYWNEGAEILYGFTKADALGRVSHELLGTEFNEPLDAIRARLMETDRWSGELRHRGNDGRQIFVASVWSLVRDEHGTPTRIIESNNDITAQKKIEQNLKQSEERFHAVFEGSGDYIYIKDHLLRFTHVNSAMCHLMGVPREEIIGKKAEDIFREEAAKITNEREARVLEGESFDVEHTVTAGTTIMTLHDTVVPLNNLAGEIIGVYCVSRNVTDRKKINAEAVLGDLQYSSPAMQRAFEDAQAAAKADSVILLQGESGSGKDFLARWVHDRSDRSKGPYFAVNCAAVPAELAESEFFGHERGAFTGAQTKKRGLLELAEGGTILLNEIGELTLPIQSKLLTFLDTRSFVRVGGQNEVHVNARLIAATHRDLQEEVEEKRFLEPLYYRINVFPIKVPPLRERREDMPVLIEQIMLRLARELQLKELPIVDSRVLQALSRYDWPGNVRELRNVLERSLMLWRDGPFAVDMPGDRKRTNGWSYLAQHRPNQGLDDVLQEVAFSLCEHALKASEGNKKEAARRLHISRDTLYRHLKRMERKRRKATHASSLF